jgi:dipeptidyl aminopeptidase/acylaminoacyl peptidase
MFYRVAATVALLVLSRSVVAQGEYLTMEDVISLKRVTSVNLSPTGEFIAYTLWQQREIYKDADGPAYVELHLTDLEGNSRPYVTGKVNVGSVSWAPDGESIYFLSKREPDAAFNSIYEISVNGGEARKVFTHVSNIGAIYPSPDGETIAFTATGDAPEHKAELAEKGFKAVVYEEELQDTNVWLLDIDSGEVVAHDLPGSAHAFDWAADGAQYAVALAPTPLVDDSYTSQDIYVVDADDGEVENEIGSVGKLGRFEFSPDGERIAYIGSVSINDPANGRLYVASTGGGERREVVPDYPGHVVDFAWQDDVTIDWLGDRGVWSEWQTASIMNTRPAGPAPNAGPVITSVDTHPGMDIAAAVGSTPEHPPEVYLLREGRAPLRLTNTNPVLAERRLARQEVITYRARDGLQIEALLIHPATRERGGNPLVTIVHGGPESHYSNGWITSYGSPGQVLAGKGYAVVYPNYRGSTGRGVEYSMLSQHDYAEEEFNDLVDVKRHLVDEGLVDPNRVGITGGSYGGYATMWSASALTEEYAAAVAFVGISNQISKFGTGDIPFEMYHVHSRAWPWEDWMWMLERSPVYHAGKTKTPLLIMGGDADPRVNPEQSLEMYRFVKIQTDTPVRLVIYPGEVHGNRNTAARYDYGLRLVRWMDHYLKGPGGDAPPYDIGHAERLAEASAGGD